MQMQAQEPIFFLPYVIQTGDILVIRYPRTNTIKRKYLLLSIDEGSNTRRAFCTVLYADRYVNPGETLWVELSNLPPELCLIERKEWR